MSIKVEGELTIGRDAVVRTLINNLNRDLAMLQVAMIKENKHEIGTYLGAAVQRSQELQGHFNDVPIVG